MITGAITYWASRTPERAAIVFDGQDTVDYATLDRWTDHAAAAVAERGARAGNRVGVVGANSLEWCVAAIGALKAGCVVAPYNNRFTTAELVHLVADSDPALVLTDDATAQRVADATADRCATAHLSEFSPLRHRCPITPPRPSSRPDDAAVLIYTSGSTAAPKGVVYTHRSMSSFIGELAISEPALCAGAKIIYTLSMSGAPGLPWHVLHPLSRGMTVYYEKGFVAANTLSRLTSERIEVMVGVPMQFEQMAALPSFAAADLSALQLCTVAGARVPIPALRAWMSKGVTLRQAYGMTELSGLCTINPSGDAAAKPGSIGRGMVFTRMRVVRPDGGDCAPGDPGEIVVAGPAVAPGYWRNDEATAALLRDGWLHTGDVGVADGDGSIEVVDRMKDIIVSGGFNIAPSEIEAVIGDLPGVAEVCVIATADAKFGETPAAVVYCPEGLDTARLVTWCDGRLAPYKVPRYIVVESAPLPRMASGKIARRELARRYADLAGTHPRVR